ncbi:DMT family transporter [Rhizobium sp. KVB221]|uniref:DMT family transporter n=1 Tax=Rhizobium setariae TaxID=2801340 RepID=A0A937CQY6_9HYPH|nr:DMT family transporter [Rhizobium setariae]MBL0374603.1 DMT family transporter [Rhizobium setariae]
MKSHQTGYLFALLAFVIFTTQDALSKHLSESYPPILITMIRYWAFGTFAIILAGRSKLGVGGVANSNRPYLQVFRGVLLALQIVVTITSFKMAGLIHSQAIFSAQPLIVAMLSVPILGEAVGWRRWTAICVGMIGVLIILNPEPASFDKVLLIPVLSSCMMAVYSIATRLASRTDTTMTSFFYTGVAGAIAMLVIGPFYWTNMAPSDWIWMALLCATGIVSHFCLIKAYDHLDAVLVQPFGYLQLVLSSFVGVLVFGETLHINVVVGSIIVVSAGLFTIWREAVTRRKSTAHG